MTIVKMLAFLAVAIGAEFLGGFLLEFYRRLTGRPRCVDWTWKRTKREFLRSRRRAARR
jgi:hypothetical protein